ncbi:hypothetical protein BGZ74_002603 [Mortierella antarctica]|nr:hypothetical protein BGZ74_002603 [Mortierella antarctica]
MEPLEDSEVVALVIGCIVFLIIVFYICKGIKNFRTRTSMKLDKIEEQLARLESIQIVIDALPQLARLQSIQIAIDSLPQLLEQRLRDTEFQYSSSTPAVRSTRIDKPEEPVIVPV